MDWKGCTRCGPSKRPRLKWSWTWWSWDSTMWSICMPMPVRPSSNAPCGVGNTLDLTVNKRSLEKMLLVRFGRDRLAGATCGGALPGDPWLLLAIGAFERIVSQWRSKTMAHCGCRLLGSQEPRPCPRIGLGPTAVVEGCPWRSVPPTLAKAVPRGALGHQRQGGRSLGGAAQGRAPAWAVPLSQHLATALCGSLHLPKEPCPGSHCGDTRPGRRRLPGHCRRPVPWWQETPAPCMPGLPSTPPWSSCGGALRRRWAWAPGARHPKTVMQLEPAGPQLGQAALQPPGRPVSATRRAVPRARLTRAHSRRPSTPCSVKQRLELRGVLRGFILPARMSRSCRLR